MSNQSQSLVASGVVYYHPNDEAAFFEWLARIDCVGGFQGEGHDVFIHLSRRPTDADLRELAAFFYRYKVDMRQLARFGTSSRRAWFRDPKMYWHRGVFGTGNQES